MGKLGSWARNVLGRPEGLLSQTASYASFRVLNAALPVLLVPVMTRYLSPADYGIMSTLSLTVAMLAPAVGFGMPLVVRRRYFDREEIDFDALLLSTVTVVGVALCVLTPLCLVAHRALGFAGLVPVEWVLAVMVWVAGLALQGLHLTLLQLEGRTRAFGLTTSLVTAGNLVLSLWLVVGLQMGWQGRALGPVVAHAAIGAYALWSLRRRVRPGARPTRERLRDAVRYAAPTVPNGLLQRAVAATDRLVVIGVAGLAIGGEYAVSSQIAGVLNVFAQAFITAFQPWLFARLKRDDEASRVEVVRALYLALSGLAVGAAMLSVVVDWVLPWVVGPRFSEAGRFVPWLAAAFAIRNGGMLLNGIILFRERHARMVILSVVSAAVNYPLSIFMVSRFGPNGAAQATCFIYACSLLVIWIVAARVQRLPWRTPF